MAPSPIHIGSGQLRSKICPWRTCTPSPTNIGRKLQSHNWMGRKRVHWHHLRLGPHAQAGPPIHGWIHQKGAQTIQTWMMQETKPAAPKHHHQIWSKEAMRSRTFNLSTIGQIRQEIHPISFWQVPIFGLAIDSTLLCPISAIALQAAKPTNATMEQTIQLLDYIATLEEAVLMQSAINMKFALHSDASYLSEAQARSRARPLLPVEWSHNTHQQGRGANHCTHHKTHPDISNWSRTDSTLHHGSGSSVHQNNIGRNGL